jgi:hypothetical protein
MYKNNLNSSVDACLSSHIKLEHVITCLFGCTNGKMHVDSFSDVAMHTKRWVSLRGSYHSRIRIARKQLTFRYFV